jgi:hypothetical protein
MMVTQLWRLNVNSHDVAEEIVKRWSTELIKGSKSIQWRQNKCSVSASGGPASLIHDLAMPVVVAEMVERVVRFDGSDTATGSMAVLTA